VVSDPELEKTLRTSTIGFGTGEVKVSERSDAGMIAEAVAAALRADVVVACLGELNNMSGEGSSRSEIDIPAPQIALLKALKATGKPVVLLLNTGRPLVITDVEPLTDAILCCWALGAEAGHGVADVVFGDVSPSGKLTASWPRSFGQVPIYYNHKMTGRPIADDAPYQKFTSDYIEVVNGPLYPFGYGLSYTDFEYSDIRLSSVEMSLDGSVDASVTVSNTGRVDADEIVQLYIRDLVASSTRPVLELKGFKKVHIPAGESVDVSFTLNSEALSFYNHDLKWVCEPGEFNVSIGPSSLASDLHTAKINVTK